MIEKIYEKIKECASFFNVTLTQREKKLWCFYVPLILLNSGILVMCGIYTDSMYGLLAISILMIPGTEKFISEIKRCCMEKGLSLRSKMKGKIVQVIRTNNGNKAIVMGDIEAFNSCSFKKEI